MIVSYLDHSAILLRDTQLVDASEVSFVDSRINLRKLAAIGEILDRFRRSQNMIYNFKTFDELKSYLSEEHNSFSVEVPFFIYPCILVDFEFRYMLFFLL